MTTTIQPHLPAAVVDQAIHLIARQGATPKSPGARTPDGRAILCASAALAVAGLESQGDFDRAGELREGIDGTGAKEGIRRVFVERGWSAELCKHVMHLNDGIPPSERTQGVTDYLRTLRAPADTG